MTIRQAKKSDLKAIRELNTAIFVRNAEYDDDMLPNFALTDEGKKYFEEAIVRSDGCFFVAEDNGRLIGYVNGGALELPYRKCRYFEIENLGVLPSEKRKGLGSKLLQFATEWAKANGFQKIYIESYARNEEALAFYRKHGYQDIDISLEKTL